ncbi:MAG TPA: threonine synthase [Candidatus Pacearchaeota archaeon]|nr:threonine synthase [archaeon BMS3Abin17]HDK42820.1 threonine synthase [Candidatus Pacearchaeota archaeon]HDZ61361.1 threonine synthase [Candidatus Pacearchaeota archaeon]
MKTSLKCIIPTCDFEGDINTEMTKCPKCGNLLDVIYSGKGIPHSFLELFKRRKATPQSIFDKSGVWRFRELLPFPLGDGNYEQVLVSLDGKEGQTSPFKLTEVAKYVGLNKERFYLQFEGDNPTGSFKDNGMAACFTHAKMLGKTKVVCASTGNTAASMAAFAANELGAMGALVFVGSDKIAIGKLAQSLEYGAKVIQIKGDFDDAMKKVLEISKKENIYLMNSVNPFRLEGQKTIMYRLLEGLGWNTPDWVVLPGGNLGNTSAFGKAFYELKKMGLIEKIPRIAIINSKGADTLHRIVNEEKIIWNNGEVDFEKIEKFYGTMDKEDRKAKTICSAIEINRPVNLLKALRTIELSKGVVRTVTDDETLDAKAIVGRNGFGCEPASATTIAGIKNLVKEGIIKKSEVVVGILTGNQLKDPVATIDYHKDKRHKFANTPVQVENDLDEITKAVSG